MLRCSYFFAPPLHLVVAKRYRCIKAHKGRLVNWVIAVWWNFAVNVCLVVGCPGGISVRIKSPDSAATFGGESRGVLEPISRRWYTQRSCSRPQRHEDVCQIEAHVLPALVASVRRKLGDVKQQVAEDREPRDFPVVEL